jgi:hypothetical protein
MNDHPKSQRAKLVETFGSELGNSIADIHNRKALEDDLGVSRSAASRSLRAGRRLRRAGFFDGSRRRRLDRR